MRLKIYEVLLQIIFLLCGVDSALFWKIFKRTQKAAMDEMNKVLNDIDKRIDYLLEGKDLE